jgi:hypothetical protein
MRLAVVLLTVGLTGSMASADESKPTDPYADQAEAKPAPEAKPDPKPATKLGLRVVRVMPESHQALLFDKGHNTHVLVELGGTIAGYTVSEIDEETVTLTKEGSELVLAAPPHRGRNADDSTPAAKPAKKANSPEDPYANATPADSKKGPQDPYADGDVTMSKTSVRTVEAPHSGDAGDGGIRVVESPDAKAPAPAPAVDAPATAPATVVVVVGPGTTPARGGDLVLTRAAFRAELADFGKLANGVKASFVADGTQLDAVTPSSLFARAGLKAKDVIVAVNGQPLRSIDDAAELYAHASNAKTIAVDLRRGGKSMTLHVTIQ